MPVSGDISPCERIARFFESDDETDLSGFATMRRLPAPPRRGARRWWGGRGYADRVPALLGLRCRRINRSYALVIFGGQAMVVHEQPHGPVNDRYGRCHLSS
jgi:hypothetical protein